MLIVPVYLVLSSFFCRNQETEQKKLHACPDIGGAENERIDLKRVGLYLRVKNTTKYR
jgi:hypothetical protein